MKQLNASQIETTGNCLAEELEKASNEAVRAKLILLAAACRFIITETTKRLTIAEAVREHNLRGRENKLSLSEQTVRNTRPGGNPYMTIYRGWENVAVALLTVPVRAHRKGTQIMSESDLHTIKDPTLRHQVTLMFAQNRSLYNENNALKQLQGQKQIRVSIGEEGRPYQPAADDLTLTGAEIDAVRDFLDPRKLKAKSLKKSDGDGVVTIDNRSIADPGFLTALRKISKSYEKPE